MPWAEAASTDRAVLREGRQRKHLRVGVERMLRIYFLQQWFNLSDPAVEEALYDSVLMRQFAGIDLGQEPVPDETTVCVPSSAGRTRFGRADAENSESAPAEPGSADYAGNDRGRDHYPCPQFDQEPRAEA